MLYCRWIQLPQNNEFQTFQELLSFHNSNSKSFNEEAVKMISELQSVNDGLRELVEGWASVKPRVNESMTSKAITWHILQGNRFEEVTELEKIASLNVGLRSIINGLLSKVQWLQTVNSTMRLVRMSVHNVVATGEASDETFLMLWEAGTAYLQFQTANSLLRKALEIIDNINFSTAILKSDLCGPKFSLQLLQLASEFVEKATKDAIEAMGSVKFSEAKKNDNS
jgi:hypothetical protein